MLAVSKHVRGLVKYKSSSAFRVSASQRETQELATSIAERLASHKDACTTIVDSLGEESRQQLLKTLIASEASQGKSLEKDYVDILFRKHDQKAPFGLLERSEFEAAMRADRTLRPGREAAASADASQTSVVSIALASSIPFIGMGAVDNAIMLVAGSEIDAAFGAKLGLSTLAAAGLGNMVSDVAGVSIANRIENITRKVKWFNDAAYKAGSRSRHGRAAKLTGSVIGVSIGCLLGMAPLLFMEAHPHE